MKTPLLLAALALLTAPLYASPTFDPKDPNAAAFASLESSLPSAFRSKEAVPCRTASYDELLDALGRLYGPAERLRGIRISVDGLYVRGEGIRIRPTPGDSAREILTHEWGHYVEDRMCTDAERSSWRTLYARESASKRLPSQYAYTNELEGFAESFLAFARGRRLDPDIKSYFTALQTRLSR